MSINKIFINNYYFQVVTMVRKSAPLIALLAAALTTTPVGAQDRPVSSEQESTSKIDISIPSVQSGLETTIQDEPLSQSNITTESSSDMTPELYSSLPGYVEATDVFGVTNGYSKTGLFYHNGETFGGYIHVRMDDGGSGQLFNEELSFYIDAKGDIEYFAPDTRQPTVLRARPNDLTRAFEYSIKQEISDLEADAEDTQDEVVIDGMRYQDGQPTVVETTEELYRRGEEIRRVSSFSFLGMYEINDETYAAYRLSQVTDNGQEMIPNIIAYYIDPEDDRIEYFSAKPGVPAQYARGNISQFYNPESIQMQPQEMVVRPAVVHLVEEAYQEQTAFFQEQQQVDYEKGTGVEPSDQNE
jgi:hypothetical protein